MNSFRFRPQKKDCKNYFGADPGKSFGNLFRAEVLDKHERTSRTVRMVVGFIPVVFVSTQTYFGNKAFRNGIERNKCSAVSGNRIERAGQLRVCSIQLAITNH